MSQVTNNPQIVQQKKWRPLGMSLLTHFFLVAFLILLGYFSRSPSQSNDGILRRAGIVVAVQNDRKETEYLDEEDLEENQSEETSTAEPTNLASEPPPPLAKQIETPDRPELPGAEMLENASLDANKMTDVPDISNGSEHYKLSDEDLKLIKSEQRLLKQRAPKGDPTTISVFGSGGMTGRSFVFVIDRSHSMGNQGLGVIGAARKEISAAINKLESHHMFQIVGYNESTHTMSRRQLLPASTENKTAVPGHIATMAAFGSTNHESGMIAALAFKPDVIMLLTDGGHPSLNSGQLKLVKQLAPNGCEIHCVQFGVGKLQKSVNFMTKMAEQNEGSFRYINVSDWRNND